MWGTFDIYHMHAFIASKIPTIYPCGGNVLPLLRDETGLIESISGPYVDLSLYAHTQKTNLPAFAIKNKTSTMLKSLIHITNHATNKPQWRNDDDDIKMSLHMDRDALRYASA